MTETNDRYLEEGRCGSCGGERDSDAQNCKKCRAKKAVRDRMRAKKLAEAKGNELSPAGMALDEHRVRWWESFEKRV